MSVEQMLLIMFLLPVLFIFTILLLTIYMVFEQQWHNRKVIEGLNKTKE